MRYLLFVFVLLTITAACSLEVPDPVFTSTNFGTTENPYADVEITGDLELGNLALGQGQHYVGFSANGFPTHTNNQLNYRSDTLVQKVVKEDDNGFLIAEYLTDGSISRTGNGPTIDADSVFRYYLRVENDTLLVLPTDEVQLRSHFFGFAVNEFPAFDLQPVLEPDVTDTWDGEFCGSCKKYARIGEWSVLGTDFSDLNVLIDTRASQVDGLGLLHIYDPAGGWLRGALHNPFLNESLGWDRL